MTPPKRIAIFGLPGSGKSHFAMKLHRRLGLPLHHLDKHFFVAQWVERDYGEFLDIQRELVAGDSWIIDGCSIKSLELRWARADLMIYVKRPRLLCLYGMFKRFFVKAPAIDDRAPNCSESVTWKLITYMWRMDRRILPLLTQLQAAYPEVRFVIVRNRRELASLIGM